MCSELDYGVVDGVGGHTECLRDGICPELPDGGMLSESESEKVVKEGVPLHHLFFVVVVLPQLSRTIT